ncbi:hypothetical protein AYI69_g4834 [Smittium culicis]|uniref:Uncharacterized protein n=1 Tax=Smittium culicis TaxID=133412 RepID=A0A1R1YAD7_9FUNG|nr:hypothetical protein AYI69_g4834 [Smittium culicis]
MNINAYEGLDKPVSGFSGNKDKQFQNFSLCNFNARFWIAGSVRVTVDVHDFDFDMQFVFSSSNRLRMSRPVIRAI